MMPVNDSAHHICCFALSFRNQQFVNGLANPSVTPQLLRLLLLYRPVLPLSRPPPISPSLPILPPLHSRKNPQHQPRLLHAPSSARDIHQPT
ncbi:hypothetical protein E2C01_033553 [Portunus trituberculatus]|uniref:Uncharacterized protein n=1 Tax=Portunus trituberculatus TaxID=210409 RepID=A0A5B7F416_PORTR|nr:hypothetical protein [Portunus trituberculatus]